MKKYIAECIGTMTLVVLGCGTAMLVGCDAVLAALKLMGWEVGAVRMPLSEIEPEHLELVKSALKKHGLLEAEK